MKNHNNSREQILTAIRKNKPEATALPSIPIFNTQSDKVRLQQTFTDVLTRISAQWVVVRSDEEIRQAISRHYPNAATVCSTHPAVTGNFLLPTVQHPVELAEVDVAVVQGLLGVAENGAIWLTEEQMVIRALPFITQHLVIILPADQIVADMHAAYQNIGQIDNGFGVFISGPSRTADIEQSLVVGAHGARSLLVCLIANS